MQAELTTAVLLNVDNRINAFLAAGAGYCKNFGLYKELTYLICDENLSEWGFMSKKIIKQLICSVALVPLLAIGDEADLFSMNLYELMQVKVTATSKGGDSVLDAPAAVSVLTAKQIEALGVRKVSEAIRFIPGVHVFDDYFTLQPIVSIRGTLEDNGNATSLLLIDGHPVFHATSSTYYVDLLPIDAIDRIEVVRGPVSVIYGTNALSGVINLITKKSFSSSVSIRAGNEQMIESTFSMSGFDGRLSFMADVRSDDGYTETIDADQDGSLGIQSKITMLEEYSKLLAKWQDDDLTVSAYWYSQDQSSKFGITPSRLFSLTEPFENESTGIQLRWNNQWSEDNTITVNAHYNQMSYKYKVDNYQILQGAPAAPRRIGTGDWNGNKYGVDVYNQYSKDAIELLFGASFDVYNGDPVSFETGVSEPFVLLSDDSDSQDAAVYSSVNWQAYEKGNLHFAVRYVDNQESGGNTNVRLGWLHKIDDKWTAKLLYGDAYRSPTLFEKNVNAAPVQVGNPDLKIEESTSIEGILIYQGANQNWQISLYDTETDNEIAAISDENGTGIFTNLAGTDTRGAEFEWRYNFSNDVQWQMSGSRIFSKNLRDTGESQPGYRSQLTASLGWQITPKLYANQSIYYYGKWQEISAFNVSNLKLAYQYSPAISFKAEVYNLFDEEYDYAEFLFPETESIPGGPPLRWQLGVVWDWN